MTNLTDIVTACNTTFIVSAVITLILCFLAYKAAKGKSFDENGIMK